MSGADKYTGGASGWTQREYADAARYLRRRAELIAEPLVPGATVLDLACGDGGLRDFVEPLGLRYRGVDLNEAMVDEAHRHGVDAERGDLNDYVPPEPVAATTLFRALYYAHDRAAFFRHVAGYTTTAIVFDVNPRQYSLPDVVRDLHAAGFRHVRTRPFFVPQNVALPGPVAALAQAAETTPLAGLVLRARFTYVLTGVKAPS